MSSSKLISEQNYKAQLATQFNSFYTQITSPNVSQIGNYKIIHEIGEGAFGKVYLASHVLLNVRVVLKCGLINDPNIVREIYYHKQLKHKNIVSLYEVIKTENHLWIVLEYCEGSELFYHIYEKKRLDLRECQSLFFQIVIALKYVHSLNLSHRDLKLENILLADKKKTIVKLTDFGFVREYNPQTRKFLSTLCGTTVYMAPELLKSEKYSGFHIDIWSLGVILFTMVYGEMPFDEDDDLKTKYKIINEEPRYRDTIPADLIELIQSMLSKDPTKRPSLNQILNSSFLIDRHNKYLDKASRHTSNDAESILSINQHYHVNTSPFQTKIEKDLVKKLHKLNFNVDELQNNVSNNQINSLTAFYELLLTREFSRKKKRYYREKSKTYYEAKKSLQRSKNRVRSALSLTDLTAGQGTSQPLEKIKSSLSIASMKNSTKTTVHRLSDPKRVTSNDFDAIDDSKRHPSDRNLHSDTEQSISRKFPSDLEQRRIDSYSSRNSWSNSLNKGDPAIGGSNATPSSPASPIMNSLIQPDSPKDSPRAHASSASHIDSSQNMGNDTPNSRRNIQNLARSSVDGPPLERTVSFYPEESNIQRISVPETKQWKASELNGKRSKNAKFLKKLKFWKSSKRNNDDNESSYSHARTYGSTESEVHDSTADEIERSLENLSKRNTSNSGNAKLQESLTVIPDSVRFKGTKEDGDLRESPKIFDKNLSPSITEGSATRSSRPRPTSMISQLSQMSQFSQMSTMLSESELDHLDETDTMEEDYDDDDGIYEASLNTSQDFHRNSSSGVSKSQSAPRSMIKRPSYRRTTSSEQSIKSSSTSATNYKHQKKFSLSQLSSNSSEESSIKSNNNGYGMPIPTKPIQPGELDATLSQVQNQRPNSPELLKVEKRLRGPWFGPNNSPSPSNGKSSSNTTGGMGAFGGQIGPSSTSENINPATNTFVAGPYKSDIPYFRSHSPPVPKFTKNEKTKSQKSNESNPNSKNSLKTTAEPKKVYEPVINEEEEND